MDARFALVTVLALALVAPAVPQTPVANNSIAIPAGRISKTVMGSIQGSANVAFTMNAKAGQTLVVNAVGASAGFEVIATVAFPKGGQDGDKGVPNYAEKLTQSGTYKITVGRNLMASTAKSGRFVLEVVLY